MSLEDKYFYKDYEYEAKFVNKYIAIIRFSKDKRRVDAYKNLVFKMMKDIVKKNISNYMNLLNGTCMKDDLPERSELIADCYIVFDRCLELFKITKKNNFYFYFNKSLGRNFYRQYQKVLTMCKNVYLTEALTTVNEEFHCNSHVDMNEMLMESLGFTELEKLICESRLKGERTADFLEKNEGVNSGQYSRSLRRMKSIIIHFKEKGQI